MTEKKATPEFKTFREFYPYYLGEHATPGCKLMHFVGTSCSIAFLIGGIFGGAPMYLLAALLFGYGFAWIGHFVIEKNRPATFQHPFYSLMGDFRMYFELLFLQRSFFDRGPKV